MRDFVPSQEHEAGSAEVNGADLRGAPRFALMLRSAKLIADGVEYLCIIRDVSETGVKLRLFHPVPRAASLMIETASGQHYPMAVVWEAKNEAGFRFLERIDVDSFVSESGPYPKRPLRLRVHHPAEVRIGKDSYRAMILDISRQGARITIDTKLAIGQKFCLEAQELPLFEATVCWRREPEYGVVFSQVMGLEELARRAERMDRVDVSSLAAE
jgi:hypothetical protein